MLSSLNHLTQFQSATHFFFPQGYTHDSVEQDDYRESGEIVGILGMQSENLRKLVVDGVHVGDMPVRIFGWLTDLEICIPEYSDLTGLNLIFHHAPGLMSLSLVGYLTSDIFPTLQQHSSALLHLTSFRLASEAQSMPTITEGQLYSISEFLKGRPSLRRLYLRLSAADWAVVSTMLPTISQMQGLKVLGFHAGNRYLTREAVVHLADHLSVKLEALHLSIFWSLPDLTSPNVLLLYPLVSQISNVLVYY